MKAYSVGATEVPVNGWWKLRLDDVSTGDTGTVNNFLVRFRPRESQLTYAPPTPVLAWEARMQELHSYRFSIASFLDSIEKR